MIVGVLQVGKQWPGQKLVMERGQEDLCESTVDQLRGNRVVKKKFQRLSGKIQCQYFFSWEIELYELP